MVQSRDVPFSKKFPNANGTGLQRVPIANLLNAYVAPAVDSFFQPLLAAVGPMAVDGNATGSLICFI